MAKGASNIKLYFLILLAVTGIFVAGLGGGIWDQQTFWALQWQHQALSYVCHQLPDRSFWLNNQPMAVCSRCLGIYGGFLSGWLLLPLIDYFKNRPQPAKRAAIGAVLVNLADIIGNLVGFWENTLLSRFMLGSLAGLSVALLFVGTFFNRNIKSERDHHGRVTATGI
ncbi:DUF2085 domain-containing protein [Fodinibius salsisoli]|uniref:DUF2085 domain-containing protein n=1 Tax=Fodinibius salsisoli TaxID=2820877 RepID=A0ABT3PRV3_9BACT|nr:DUF2085 domain-containing protein [Fodinibius salsisoli]MCW9708597.1 DUF2085 domain-containing protein [Fodinibius salsisoli]